MARAAIGLNTKLHYMGLGTAMLAAAQVTVLHAFGVTVQGLLQGALKALKRGKDKVGAADEIVSRLLMHLQQLAWAVAVSEPFRIHLNYCSAARQASCIRCPS